MTKEEIDALTDDARVALRETFAETAMIDGDTMVVLREKYPNAANFVTIATKFLVGEEDSEQRRLWYEFEEDEFYEWLTTQPRPDGL